MKNARSVFTRFLLRTVTHGAIFFRWFVLLLVSSCLQSAPPRRPATSMALVNRQVSHPPAAAAARHLTLGVACRPNRVVVVVVIIVLFGRGFLFGSCEL